MSYIEWATWIALAVIAALVALTLTLVLVVKSRPRRVLRSMDNADLLDRLTSAIAAIAVTGIIVAVLLVIGAVLQAPWWPLLVMAVWFARSQYDRLRAPYRAHHDFSNALAAHDAEVATKPAVRPYRPKGRLKQ